MNELKNLIVDNQQQQQLMNAAGSILQQQQQPQATLQHSSPLLPGLQSFFNMQANDAALYQQLMNSSNEQQQQNQQQLENYITNSILRNNQQHPTQQQTTQLFKDQLYGSSVAANTQNLFMNNLTRAGSSGEQLPAQQQQQLQQFVQQQQLNNYLAAPQAQFQQQQQDHSALMDSLTFSLFNTPAPQPQQLLMPQSSIQLPSPAELLAKNDALVPMIHAAQAAIAMANGMQAKRKKPQRRKSLKANEVQTCANCGTMRTPLWRKGADGKKLCNKCGLYWARHGNDRPKRLGRPRKQKVIGVMVQDQNQSITGLQHQHQHPDDDLMLHDVVMSNPSADSSTTPVDSPIMTENSMAQTPSPDINILTPLSVAPSVQQQTPVNKV